MAYISINAKDTDSSGRIGGNTFEKSLHATIFSFNLGRSKQIGDTLQRVSSYAAMV